MIKGTKRIDLTVENVLKRITEYDVFRYYMKREFAINQVTYSPFRFESNPSFMVGNRNGYLYFIDFADSEKRGDCFDFVAHLYHLPGLYEALMMVDRDFGLGILPGHDTGEYKRIKATYKQPEEEMGKRYAVIQAITRKFTPEELSYWNEYHQDIQDLRDNHIYSISKIYLNRKLFSMKDTELRFGYLYGSNWKIYRPFSERKHKWLPNNVPITTIEGKENLSNDHPVFINKSKKDYMVIRKLYPYTCAVQNESIACFSGENVAFLKMNSKKQILSFDSDVAGVKNSQQITELFGFDYCNVPKAHLTEDIKDWADLLRVHGMDVVENYLKQKHVL
jgi:hypothetical protein